MSNLNKRCPECGSDVFIAKIIRGAAVKADDKGGFEILKETPEYEIEILKCNKCKKEVKEEDLVSMVKCSKCGTLVRPDAVDESGRCEVCRALESRSDLANASKEDIIRMLLNLEKQMPTAKSMDIQAKIEKSDAVEEKVTAIAAATVSQGSVDDASAQSDSADAASPTDTSDENTGKKRRVRKKTQEEGVTVPLQSGPEFVESTEKQVEADNNILPVQGQDITSAIDQVADGQAPFPDTPDPFASAINPPETPAPAPAPSFSMFDEQPSQQTQPDPFAGQDPF